MLVKLTQILLLLRYIFLCQKKTNLHDIMCEKKKTSYTYDSSTSYPLSKAIEKVSFTVFLSFIIYFNYFELYNR